MMKRYDKYKESGIPWIGEIPEHWEVKSLKQIASCNDETLTELTPVDQIIRYVEISDVNAVEGITNVVEYPFGLAPSRARRKTKINDVIVSTVRTYLRAVARVTESDLIVSTGFAVLRAKGYIDSLFLAYVIQSSDFIDEVIANSSGINYPAITANKLTSLILPIPPLSEQEAIVAYLEEKVAQMDSLAAKQEAQIAYLRELKQAIIARAVTQGLDPHAPLRPSGIPWIGNIPEHWKVQRLGRCFGENRALNSDLECTEAYKFNYGSLIRKDENLNPQELVDTYMKYTQLRENDIVINGLNLNYDFVSQRVAIATQKGIITSAYLILSPRKGINHNYYCLLFKAMDSMRLFHGMGSGIRLTLSYKDLKNQWLPFPPPSEQEAIVTHINRKTEEIDRLIAMTEQEIARVRELKQTLIADVVTGRINVQPS